MAYRDLIQSRATLLHYWPMDEASGTALAPLVGGASITLGTSTAKPTLGVTGQVDGTAVQFDGSNDFASVALSLSGYSRIVVECLFWWNGYANDDRLLMEFTANFNLNNGSFFVDPNNSSPADKFSAAHRVAGVYNSSQFDRPSAGAWHYLALDFNSTAVAASEVTPYADGAAVTYTKAQNNNTSGAYTNSTLYLFCRAAASLFGAGKMQHLAIYSGLTAAEIAEHHASAFGSSTSGLLLRRMIGAA